MITLSTKLPEGVEYSGDVNLVPYGGLFYETRNAEDGFAHTLEVIDMESAAGEEGLLILVGTIDLDKNLAEGAFQFVGALLEDDPDVRTRVLIEALQAYAGSDLMIPDFRIYSRESDDVPPLIDVEDELYDTDAEAEARILELVEMYLT